MEFVELFSYANTDFTYELGKEGRNGLFCHIFRNNNNLIYADALRTLTFDRLWALMLTTEIKRCNNRKYLVRAIYGGGMRIVGSDDMYMPAPLSSVKMQTTELFEVQGRDWDVFISAIEAWAARNNIQLVHDRV